MYNQDFSLDSPLRIAFIESQVVEVLEANGKLNPDEIRIMLITKNTSSTTISEVQAALDTAIARNKVTRIDNAYLSSRK